MAATAILRPATTPGTLVALDDDQGIYRTEVLAIMGALADLTVDVRAILRYIEGDDDDEAEAEDLPDS